SALTVLLSIERALALRNTLPPLPRLTGSLTSSREWPLIDTGASLVTVRAAVLVGSTGTSPALATPVTWILPAGADRVAPLLIVTGPPIIPKVPCTGPNWLPLTVSAGGVAVRN